MNARRNRILFLHSNEQDSIELATVLEQAGVDVTTTLDAAEALEQIGSRHFDLLLVGDHPPQVTGSEILRELQCGPVNVPCIILQSGRNSFDPEYFYSLGAAGVITDWKPEDVARRILERACTKAAAAG